MIAGHFHPDLRTALKVVAVRRGVPLHTIMQEAFEMYLNARGIDWRQEQHRQD